MGVWGPWSELPHWHPGGRRAQTEPLEWPGDLQGDHSAPGTEPGSHQVGNLSPNTPRVGDGRGRKGRGQEADQSGFTYEQAWRRGRRKGRAEVTLGGPRGSHGKGGGVGRPRAPAPEGPSWPGQPLACLLKCRGGQREGLDCAAGRLSRAIEPRAVRQPLALLHGPQAGV